MGDYENQEDNLEYIDVKHIFFYNLFLKKLGFYKKKL